MAQNNTNGNGQKNPRTLVAMDKNAGAVWKIEIPLESGGTISVQANTNIDLLAAYPGLLAVKRALSCPVDADYDLRLMERETQSGRPGFSVCCFSPRKGNNEQSTLLSQLSLNTTNINPDLLLEADEQYREWYMPDSQGNQNNQGNRSNAQGNSNRSQGNTNRATRTANNTRNNPPPPEDDGYENGSDESIPF